MDLLLFTQAVESGDLQAVEAAVEMHPNLVHTHTPVVRPLGEEKWLPLHRAAWLGHVAMVRRLLDAGGHVDARTRFHDPLLARETALHLSAAGGHLEIARLLLDQGSTLEVRDAQAASPLARAAAMGHASIVQLFLDRGAQPDPVDLHHLTPLHLAIEPTDAEADAITTAKLLIEAGANVNHLCPDEPASFTPLHRCVRGGDSRLPIAKYLLDHGSDPNICDPQQNWTPLQWAAHHSSPRYITLLS